LHDRSADLGDDFAGTLESVASPRQVALVNPQAREPRQRMGMFETVPAAAC
jgi:hypothetical protein